MKNKIMILIALVTLSACDSRDMPVANDPTQAIAEVAAFYVGSWDCTRTYTQNFSIDLSSIVINSNGTMTVDGTPYDYAFDSTGAFMQYAPDDQLTQIVKTSSGINFRWQQGNESGESGNASNWTCEPAN